MVLSSYPMSCFIAAALALFAISSAANEFGLMVSTKDGVIVGLEVTPPGQNKAVHAYLGIPYAEPPTGPLRFAMPVAKKFFPDVYQATKKPPSCFQSEFSLQFHWADHNSTMSEDCLYLNIWTPEKRSEKKGLKPVMVYIHGGGYSSGSSAMDVYDGQVISSIGDVVVVTLNYRLSVFGFLSTVSDDAPGNAGLYDQLLAIRWVNNNIEHFGGDPKRITLLGESAGALSVGFLALSPLSRGLFNRLVFQSGSSYTLIGANVTEHTAKGNLLATYVGCANATHTLFSHPQEVVTCLISVPATELFKSYYIDIGSTRKEVNFAFWPSFWNELIPHHPIDYFLNKNFQSYDVFAGLTKDEGTSLFIYAFPEEYHQYIAGKLKITKAVGTQMLNSLFTELGLKHPEKPAQFYLKDTEDERETVKSVYEAVSDYFVSCPTVFLAENYAEKGAKVKFYRFDHRPSTSPFPEWMGAAHFEEVGFVFGMPIRYPERYTADEKTLSEYMIRIWTSFAKAEDLKLQNGMSWPNYSRSDPVYATFQTGQQATGKGERQEACNFWRPYFEAK